MACYNGCLDPAKIMRKGSMLEGKSRFSKKRRRVNSNSSIEESCKASRFTRKFDTVSHIIDNFEGSSDSDIMGVL